MSENFNVEQNSKELLDNAVKFQMISVKSREKAREEYRKIEPEPHNTFRITLDGLIARLSSQLLQKFDNPTEKISYQLSLSCSLIRTHFLVNDLIMDGDLIEAFTLIRKNFESLTRLHEIDEKPLLKLLKKVPNVINLFGAGGKKLYPSLSEIAHFATPVVGDLLTVKSFEDGRSGPSLHPAYNSNSLSCYDKHAYVSIYFSFWFINFLKKIYGEKYDHAKDETTFGILIQMAIESEIVHVDKPNAK